MRPASHNMYGQPAYTLPQNPVQYYAVPGNSPVPHYGRNSQDAQPQLQPVYLVHHQQPAMAMQPYPAVVGMPTQVVGNPIPQAMAVPGVPGYGAQGWAYRPVMVEPPPNVPVWGYGPDQSRGYSEQQQQQQELRNSSNWQRGPQQGYGRSGAAVPGGFHGRAEVHSSSPSLGNPSGDSRRPDRGFESSNGGRHHPSGGPGRQHMNRQAPIPQSPASSQSKQLNCEACEKSFTVPSQYTAHMHTHVQCDETGCSFSASGKVVKEHKLTAHRKSNNPNVMVALKASEEDDDEIRAWREERMRNYPTRSNIQRKKEALEGKVARGELIDEDTRKRQQRMKEILAKQAELGVPVAEVPAHYLSQSYKEDRGRGRCKKGFKCHFAHTGPRGKKGGDNEAGRGGPKGVGVEKKRPPTLLSKLLQGEINRDKSYILQCLRYFVNNNFLLNWPNQLSESIELPEQSDDAHESSDYSEGEVVEAPDVLLADTAIINTLLSERPEVLAKVVEMETEA
uniref:C2H2-type domain-containing protein n=1 Tax=Physcomitrium patens TaxID=3218 RepID=A0A7I4CVX0_PHYPA